jgi:hypothetical protein
MPDTLRNDNQFFRVMTIRREKDVVNITHAEYMPELHSYCKRKAGQSTSEEVYSDTVHGGSHLSTAEGR